MASAKPATTSRRSSSGKSPKKKGEEPEVSPARWAGVAFVIVAIMAAIVLAVISPSDPSPAPAEVAPEASPTPSPTALDTRVPTAQPRITNPVTGPTRELDFPVTVDLPEEELAKRWLTLYILRGEEEVGKLDKPKSGGSVTVPSVRVDPGPNELTAVLSGPGGFGPRSEPILLTVDRNAPELALTAPKNKTETYEARIVVEGTSEVGADVAITNETTGAKVKEVVGNSGTFDATVRLKRGVTNKIVASSIDGAGIKRSKTVRVTRLDGTPKIKIQDIDPVRRSDLPKKVRIVVDVKDADGKPMADARVDYLLGAQDRTTLNETLFTDADGRSVWRPIIEPSSSVADALELSVTVTSSLSGDSKDGARTIAFR